MNNCANLAELREAPFISRARVHGTSSFSGKSWTLTTKQAKMSLRAQLQSLINVIGHSQHIALAFVYRDCPLENKKQLGAIKILFGATTVRLFALFLEGLSLTLALFLKFLSLIYQVLPLLLRARYLACYLP